MPAAVVVVADARGSLAWNFLLSKWRAMAIQTKQSTDYPLKRVEEYHFPRLYRHFVVAESVVEHELQHQISLSEWRLLSHPQTKKVVDPLAAKKYPAPGVEAAVVVATAAVLRSSRS